MLLQPRDRIQRYSTQDVPAASRFDYWSTVLSRAISPMTVTSEDISRFEAQTSQTTLGPLAVNRTLGTAHISRHTRSDVERIKECNFHLLVSRDRPWYFAHRGHMRVGLGDLVIADSRIEHEIEIHSRFDIINIIIPLGWMRTWVPDPDCLVGRLIPGHSRWGQVLSPIATQLLPEFVVSAPLPHAVLADHVGTGLALIAAECSGLEFKKDRRLLRRVETLIEERCGDPRLTSDDIASELRIPNLALHRLLGAAGFTFATRLMHARVAKAVRLLDSPAYVSWTAAEIAKVAGFSSVDQLKRVISRRFRGPSRFRP